MDDRNNLFAKGGRPGLPGRQVQSRGAPAAQGYSSVRNYDDYSAPSPRMQGQQQGGYGGGYTDNPPPPPMKASSPKIKLAIAKVDKALQAVYIYRNICAVSPLDFPGRDGDDVYIRLTGQYIQGDAIVTARLTPGFPQRCISLSDPQRTWLQVGMTDTLEGELYEARNEPFLSAIDVEIGFASTKKATEAQYDQDVLAQKVTAEFDAQILSPGQRILMDFQSVPLLLVVKTVQLSSFTMEKGGSSKPLTEPTARGLLNNQTAISFFKSAGSPMKLTGGTRHANSIVAPDFKFEDMGIGGLDNEFSTIFRRAFASRIFPPNLIDKLGIMHVKGILLYGPPGTGKTLIARQIGKMLNAREPKVINGPEVLNKYVGQSEENIRKLFADAEKEYKEKGDESGLHIIIFDELDAVCKQRGSGAGGGTGVGDSVVNQLLSKLDGVDQLNNVLLIGMTNRKDMIDDALLRPGRLEVQIEISLPDEAGRVQILEIHTSKMAKNGVMDTDVNIPILAARTKNFSGAELNGLVKSATSFAFNRHIKVDSMAAISDDVRDMKVNMSDFESALLEVKPAFGVDSGDLEQALVYGIIDYSTNIQGIIRDGMTYVENVRQLERLRRLSVLLHGPKGSGKTALATHIALQSGFSFIKAITPESLVGFVHEGGKKDYLHKVFTDAYKSPLSLLILDDIERLVEWNPIGPRMSNIMVQALLTLLQATPPKGHRLLIIATSSRHNVLQELDMIEAFDRSIPVPAVSNLQELYKLLQGLDSMNGVDLRDWLQTLQSQTRTDKVNVGIKTVLTMAESASMVEDPKEWFVEQLGRAIISANV